MEPRKGTLALARLTQLPEIKTSRMITEDSLHLQRGTDKNITVDKFFVNVYILFMSSEISRMQENLLLIRLAVGWTAEKMGDRIGVTRQTINNIENGRSRLTKTQYIAIRSVLDAEMAESPVDTKMLKALLEIFVDHPDKYGKEKRKELLAKANLMAPSILAGTATRKDASKEWVNILKTVAGSLVTSAIFRDATVAISDWLFEILTSGSSKHKKS